ncbi:acyltransferase family protein [Hymenobacter actinosclerus]|uniref:Peptidoglycan/LPS O-acetylase OafA/YrhL, contains acyltransferase and SGNH-hydrolase domains n=1 Tax=Hymenobacter actinosclerus TaxID=82805 RepID=A0A1I0GWY5_9BACT|nr:acyltransferase [Hymenobacter actinosclerus]SET75910.1 Peptidoglycan/LPS O-acetylase OafA/YrhL, contains acyltransferase and SGNH-hydrolase domains [Hymenobacter actinosclerus]
MPQASLPSSPKRQYELDLLRFAAALAVVLFHYTFRGYAADGYSPIAYPELAPYTKYGYLGVELFFIISGYVILLSTYGKTVRQFFVSRVTRLYPAFWVACTLTFVVERLWGKGPADPAMASNLEASFRQYAYNMTMLQDFFGVTAIDGAYWSLSIEITFYFIISLLIGYRLIRHIDVMLVLWLGCVFVTGSLPATAPFAYLLFPQYAPYFIAGMVFQLLQQPAQRTYLRYLILFTSYHLAVQNSLAQAELLGSTYHTVFSPLVVVSIITLFYLSFMLIALRIVTLNRFAWLAWLGVVTYPLYLLHSNIAFVAFHRIGHLFNKYLLLGLTLIVMIGAAYLIHFFVERPFTKKLRSYLQQLLVQFDTWNIREPVLGDASARRGGASGGHGAAADEVSSAKH